MSNLKHSYPNDMFDIATKHVGSTGNSSDSQQLGQIRPRQKHCD